MGMTFYGFKYFLSGLKHKSHKVLKKRLGTIVLSQLPKVPKEALVRAEAEHSCTYRGNH